MNFNNCAKLRGTQKFLQLKHKCCLQVLKRELKTVEAIPGPKQYPFIGSSWIFSPFGPYTKDDYITIGREELLLKHGPIYKERIRGTYLVSLHNPTDIELVMRKQGKYPMRPVNEAKIYFRKSRPDIYSTNGLTDTNGEEWFDIRMKVAPTLLKAGELSGYSEKYSHISDEFLQTIEIEKGSEGILDVRDILYRYALEAIWTSTLGLKLGALQSTISDEAKQLIPLSISLFDCFAKLSTSRPWWKLWNTQTYKQFCYAEEAVYNIANTYSKAVIESVRREAKFTSDTSDPLIHRYLNNPEFKDKVINTIIIDFVVAGITTTSSFLSLLLHRIGQEQEVQNRIYKELESLNLKKNSVITDAILNDLLYLGAVLKEGYRLATIIPGILRILENPIEIDGYTIPAFTPIVCQTRAACLNDKYFTSPQMFIPERWYTDLSNTSENMEIVELQEQAKKNRFLLLPFGFGSRMCVGRRLAVKEMLVLLAKILINYRIESYGEMELANNFIITPKSSVDIKFIER